MTHRRRGRPAHRRAPRQGAPRPSLRRPGPPRHRLPLPLGWHDGGVLPAHRRSRVIVNTGMGYEAPHHKRVFDAVRPGPTPYVMTTQAHVDHVGGRAAVPRARHRVRGPGEQPGLPTRRRPHPASCGCAPPAIWFDMTGRDAMRIAAENPGVSMHQDAPVARRHLRRPPGPGRRRARLELIAAVGETDRQHDRVAPRAPDRPDQQPVGPVCSPTSPISTRCEATATDWWSPTSSRVRRLRAAPARDARDRAPRADRGLRAHRRIARAGSTTRSTGCTARPSTA